MRPERELEGGGSSAMIVLSAIELMSLSCSSLEVRLSHSVSFSQNRLASFDLWTNKPRVLGRYIKLSVSSNISLKKFLKLSKHYLWRASLLVPW